MWLTCLPEPVWARVRRLRWGFFSVFMRFRTECVISMPWPPDAIHVEQELLQEAVGAQDQVSAAYGGFNRINFHTDGTHRGQAGAGSAQADWQNSSSTWRSTSPAFARTASEIAQEQVRMTPQRKQELDTMLQLVDEAESIVTNPGRLAR